MIRFAQVSFSYDEDIPALHDINFEVNQGERVGLIGLNGSGKSTLLRLAAGLLLPTKGDVFVDGAATNDAIQAKTLRSKVGFIFQNPEDQIISSTVETDIAFTLENFGVDRVAMREQVGAKVEQFKLTDLLRRHPASLSAGELQRTALAAVLVAAPRLLLLDEPTSFLDHAGRGLLFQTLFGDRRYTIIAATQHLSEIDRYDRAIFLEKGAVIFFGSPTEFRRTDIFAGIDPIRAKDSEIALSRSAPRNDKSPTSASTVIRVKSVQFGYSSQTTVLQDIDLEIVSGTITAVIGESGSGKTTLALLLSELLRPQSGEITFAAELPAKNRVALLFQFPESSFFAESVFEEIAFGIRKFELPRDEEEKRVREALRQVGLSYESFRERNPFTLSAGERRRVAIAATLILDYPVIIFDEVTLGLDWEGRKLIVELIHSLRERCKTIIVITHDFDFVKQVADFVVLLDQGTVRWQGSTTSPSIPREFVKARFGEGL